MASEIVHRYSAYVYEMLKEQDAATIENIKAVLEILVNSAHRQENTLNGKYSQGGGRMSIFEMNN